MRTETIFEAPGVDRNLAWLVELSKKAAAAGSGEIVFVAGEQGSGRSSLLRCLSRELCTGTPHPTVLAGAFDQVGYSPWEELVPPAGVTVLFERIRSIGEPAAALAGGLIPLAGLLGQILSKSQAALQLIDALGGEDDLPDVSTLFPRVLRELCQEKGPVVWIVDDADGAPDGWWMELVLLFARRVARDLPLLIVLAVEGPPELGPHVDGEPEAMGVARQLTQEGLAQWQALPPLRNEDLQRAIGLMTPDVARALLEVTGGRAGWTWELWHDWQRRSVVARESSDARWHFTTNRTHALDKVEDLLGERLKRLVGPTDRKAAERARRLLCCAALEGRRFTAEAVADALGRDRDEVNDELDEILTFGDERPDGLLLDSGSVKVVDEKGSRTLWLYRFKAQLDWLTLRHHGMSDSEETDLSLKLANALQGRYGGDAYRVSQPLARLYATAGDDRTSKHYRRMGLIGVNRDLILWRADTIVESPDPDGPSERNRASIVLLAAASQLFHSGPFQRGFAYSDRAHRLATNDADRATALFYCGVSQGHLGNELQALGQLTAARDLFCEIDNRRGEATARNSLAIANSRQSSYLKAQAEHLAVLSIRQELGDRYGEAITRSSLATIHAYLGDREKAREEYLAVLEIRLEIGDRQGESQTLLALATVAFEEDNFNEARDGCLAALEIQRELGDRHGESESRSWLAHIDLKRGNYEEAREEYLAVLEMQREIGDRRVLVTIRQGLANINLGQGNYEKAREECLAILRIQNDIGNRQGEAQARRGLADIYARRGEYDKAREEYLTALTIQSDIDDRRGESTTRRALEELERPHGGGSDDIL